MRIRVEIKQWRTQGHFTGANYVKGDNPKTVHVQQECNQDSLKSFKRESKR